MLGGDHRPLDDHEVELGGQQVGGELLGALGSDRGTGDHPGVLDLADTLADQLGFDGLGVQFLHPQRGLLRRLGGDLVENRVGIVKAGPQPFQVEHPYAAELTDGNGSLGADHTVHGRGHKGQVEAVGVDLPGDAYILGVAGPAGGDDGDVVESVRPPSGLAQPDLHLGHRDAPFVLETTDSKALKPPTGGFTPRSAQRRNQAAD